jgi:hypothetical protein
MIDGGIIGGKRRILGIFLSAIRTYRNEDFFLAIRVNGLDNFLLIG